MDGTIMGDGEGTIEEYKEGGRHPPYVSSPSNYTAVFAPTDHQLLQYFTTLRTRVWPPNSIPIGSAVFAGYTGASNKHADWYQIDAVRL